VSKVSPLLRPLQEDDLPLVLAWRNHDDVRSYMYSQHEISPAEHARWFANASQDAKRHLLIYQPAGKPQGFVSFHQLRDSAVAEWGFYLAPDAEKGTGSALGRAALNYAFGSLKLHKVCAEALSFNERSRRFHEKLGFQQEGVLRDHYFDGSRYHAVYCFGLLTNEWSGGASES
jgi:UDP-4-amino-4,6-dideoxy-N-acetyl-beta-L-altrosamine N-acetyltransferase